MNKKTLTALGAFVVLAIIALVTLRQPEKGERASDHPRPIPALSPAEITTLDVTKGGVTTTLKNEGGIYKMTAPGSYPVDQATAKSAFEALGKMDITDLVTQQDAKQAEFEVDDKSGVRLVAKHDGKVLADLIVGKSVGAGTMVRPSGTNDVWRASGITKFVFDKGPPDWRDKSITTFPAADVEKLDVVAKDGAKISLKKTGTKQGNEDKWEVVSSTVKIDTLDNSVPNGMVQTLSNWKASDFLNGVNPTVAAEPSLAGLAPPALTVTVGLKGGKSVVALLGSKRGDDELFVKKADAPQVFVVKKYGVEKINKRPIEFRDKTLCDLAAADLTEISVAAGDKSYTLVKNGNDWKATKPPKLEVDATKVTPIASLQGLEGERVRRRSVAEGRRPRQAQGGHQRQEQGAEVERPGLLGPRGRREHGQGELRRCHGQEPRRLPGAQVGDRPDPGQTRRSQEGRRGDECGQPGQAGGQTRRDDRRQEVARVGPSVTRRGARPASRGGG